MVRNGSFYLKSSYEDSGYKSLAVTLLVTLESCKQELLLHLISCSEN